MVVCVSLSAGISIFMHRYSRKLTPETSSYHMMRWLKDTNPGLSGRQRQQSCREPKGVKRVEDFAQWLETERSYTLCYTLSLSFKVTHAATCCVSADFQGWFSEGVHHSLKTALNRINGAILPTTFGAVRSTSTCSTGGCSNQVRRGTAWGASFRQSFKMNLQALEVDSDGNFRRRILPISR